MNQKESMSRRRFLIVTAASAGAAGLAALGITRQAFRTSGTPEFPRHGDSIDGKTEIVQVNPGYIDATEWQGEVLTLRPSSDQTRIVLRSETQGINYIADLPSGFVARCIGVVDGMVTVGGHQDQETDHQIIEVGDDYGTLLAGAGVNAELLRHAPSHLPPVEQRHVFRDRLPSVMFSSELEHWSNRNLEINGIVGSCGAIAERSDSLVLERYSDAEAPDSVFDVAVMRGREALGLGGQTLRGVASVDHGGLWGSAHSDDGDILIVSDRTGTRGIGLDGSLKFDLDKAYSLIAVDTFDESLFAYAVSGSTATLRFEFQNGIPIGREILTREQMVRHRVNSGITIAEPQSTLRG